MSAIQSKAKGPSGKRTAYYGRLSGGSMSCRSSELTRDDVITPARLRVFSPSDFEAYGARGEEFRRHLCGAVLHALKLRDAWRTDCESRGEWGGVFPVHLRLTHRTCKHVTLDILSPGAESPFWHGLIWIMPDHTGLYVLNSERFDPVAIRALKGLVCCGARPLCPLARKAHRRAQAQERLVTEAETDLAGQTATTYRLWYRRWRTRSVATADLLNMTWAWRQRAADADFTTR